MREITLFPSNWLYNAGVVGFLSCLDRSDYLDNLNTNDKKYSFKNGIVQINKNLFEKIKVAENYFNNKKVVNLKGKNPYYPNFIDAGGNQESVFKSFVEAFSNFSNTEDKSYCYLCNLGIDVESIVESIIQNSDQIQRFFNKISNLNMAHNRLLGPSDKFPNAYWNLEDKLKICHLCTFILIHHHLAFTKLSDGSEIFINAPSFNVMYELNKLVRELFGNQGDAKQKREILAMSIIEYARRIQTTLAQWTAMNIEVIIKSGEGIDFYTLPYETTRLISDRNIASLLSDIGEFSVLNCILDGRISELLDIAYLLIRINIKQEKNKSDNPIIKDFLKKENNRKNLGVITQKILKLYANILDRRKTYDRTTSATN